MTCPKASIIVPVHNAGPYLPACLDSILGQTLREIEVILVDDGSTDDSAAICDRYAGMDPRIRVIHQANGGVGNARNAGLEIANGEFIGFVDGDDLIDPDMVELLYRNAQEHQADISICGFYDVRPNQPPRAVEGTGDKKVFSRDEAIRSFYSSNYLFPIVCNKLFRHTTVGTTRFEPFTINEDGLFSYCVYLQSKAVVLEDVPKYHYIKRQASATQTPFSARRFDFIKANRRIHELTQARAPEFQLTSEAKWLRIHFDLIDNIIKFRRQDLIPEFRTLFREVRANIGHFLHNPLLTWQDRISLFLLAFCLPAYSSCYYPIRGRYLAWRLRQHEKRNH
jgi:glycosyltransferase involved in cell wall biosynthesis